MIKKQWEVPPVLESRSLGDPLLTTGQIISSILIHIFIKPER